MEVKEISLASQKKKRKSRTMPFPVQEDELDHSKQKSPYINEDDRSFEEDELDQSKQKSPYINEDDRNFDGERRKSKKKAFPDQEDGLDEHQENLDDKRRKRRKMPFPDQVDGLDEDQQKSPSINEDDMSPDGETCHEGQHTVQYIWGKRFTKEEDEILKDAIWAYIRSRGWDDDEGLRFILNCSKHKQARKCWEEIRICLPRRPQRVIRYRAHVLLEEGTHLGRWSKEEADTLKRLEEEHGHNWRKISTFLGRGRPNIKEKWRALKRSKATGAWTQAELQKLCNLVHECLQSKAVLGNMRRDEDHRILRGDINWEKIADDIGTHGHGSCCAQWYYTLTSHMIASGEWANGDDFILLQRLLESGACGEEEVEWDCLLDHRSGQTCLTRWQQMVKHLGENRKMQFLEKLDLLAQRYAPQLLESSPDDGGV